MKKIFLLACFFFAISAQAEELHYLKPGTLKPEFLTPPIEVRSQEWNQEIETILKAQQEATTSDFAAALYEIKVRPELVTQVLGKDFARDTKPATYMLLDKVGADCKTQVHAAKDFWKTKRPYEEDARVKRRLPKLGNGAYPSGHTACPRVMAEVLGELYPEKRGDLRARAEEMAHHRIITGVHYPHDLAGGRAMALLVFGALTQSEMYRVDLEKARAEIGK